MRMRLTEELWREGNMYVAYCPELDVPSCGETVEQAKNNLKEVILIHLMETAKMGTLDKLLQDAGFRSHDLSLPRRSATGCDPHVP